MAKTVPGLFLMEDVKLLGLFGAGTSLHIVNSVLSGLVPVLNALLLLSQVAIGVATFVLLWRKIKRKKGSKPDDLSLLLVTAILFCI